MAAKGLIERALTGAVIGAFYEVYNSLGFGFLEHVYKAALERELIAQHYRVAREVMVRIFYKDDVVAVQRMDMIVNERLVVEIKSSIDLPSVAQRQLFNYLRASHLQVGLLLHFGPEPKFYRLISTRGPSVASARSAESVSS